MQCHSAGHHLFNLIGARTLTPKIHIAMELEVELVNGLHFPSLQVFHTIVQYTVCTRTSLYIIIIYQWVVPRLQGQCGADMTCNQ